MRTRAAAALLFCLPSGLTAGTSANYTLSPATVDAGGNRGGSASYTADFSLAPGGAGGSPVYTSRTGYTGQLVESASLELRLQPSPLAETGTGQVSARLFSAEGVPTNLSPGQVAWSVSDGPLSGITADGLVTAESVYESTGAAVQGVFSGVTGTLRFTVTETVPDNFGLYAGDGLPDGWQVLYLGLSEPEGGQSGDPDGDGQNNLMEFAFGTDPGSAASGTGTLAYSGGALLSRGQPLQVIRSIPNSVDLRVVFARRRDAADAGLSYQVQFSPDLLAWTTSAAAPSLLAGDAEFEAVSVPWPFFLNGRKVRFFRMLVDLTPTP